MHNRSTCVTYAGEGFLRQHVDRFITEYKPHICLASGCMHNALSFSGKTAAGDQILDFFSLLAVLLAAAMPWFASLATLRFHVKAFSPSQEWIEALQLRFSHLDIRQWSPATWAYYILAPVTCAAGLIFVDKGILKERRIVLTLLLTSLALVLLEMLFLFIKPFPLMVILQFIRSQFYILFLSCILFSCMVIALSKQWLIGRLILSTLIITGVFLCLYIPSSDIRQAALRPGSSFSALDIIKAKYQVPGFRYKTTFELAAMWVKENTPQTSMFLVPFDADKFRGSH